MNRKDQTPSNTPDPQWDELVARLQHDQAAEAGAEDPGRAADDAPSGQDAQPGRTPATGTPEDAAMPGDAAAEGPAHQPPVPHEPSAAERAEALRKLFNTGPLARGPRDYQVDEPEEATRFVPQEPPALGAGNPVTTLSWVAAVGGPLALLLCVMFYRSAPTLLYGALAVISLIGVVMLLRTLPKDRDPGDDGARV